MLQFIQENLATVVVLLVVAFLVILAVRKIVKDKKSGVGACGNNCSECVRAGRCDSQNDE